MILERFLRHLKAGNYHNAGGIADILFSYEIAVPSKNKIMDKKLLLKSMGISLLYMLWLAAWVALGFVVASIMGPRSIIVLLALTMFAAVTFSVYKLMKDT